MVVVLAAIEDETTTVALGAGRASLGAHGVRSGQEVRGAGPRKSAVAQSIARVAAEQASTMARKRNPAGEREPSRDDEDEAESSMVLLPTLAW